MCNCIILFFLNIYKEAQILTTLMKALYFPEHFYIAHCAQSQFLSVSLAAMSPVWSHYMIISSTWVCVNIFFTVATFSMSTDFEWQPEQSLWYWYCHPYPWLRTKDQKQQKITLFFVLTGHNDQYTRRKTFPNLSAQWAVYIISSLTEVYKMSL